MMGTALCWSLADNGDTVRLVGAPLDEATIRSIRETGIHPRLERQVPDRVTPHSADEITRAVDGADLVIGGVSSFGVDWFAEAVGPHLRPGVPVLSVTKASRPTPTATCRSCQWPSPASSPRWGSLGSA